MQGRQIVQDPVLRQRRPHTLSAGRRSQDGVRQGATWHRKPGKGATGGGTPTSHAHRPPPARARPPPASGAQGSLRPAARRHARHPCLRPPFDTRSAAQSMPFAGARQIKRRPCRPCPLCGARARSLRQPWQDGSRRGDARLRRPRLPAPQVSPVPRAGQSRPRHASRSRVRFPLRRRPGGLLHHPHQVPEVPARLGRPVLCRVPNAQYRRGPQVGAEYVHDLLLV